MREEWFFHAYRRFRRRNFSPISYVISSRHVQTLHPKLHLARTGRAFQLAQPAFNLRPRYNIAPTTQIDVLRLVEGVLDLE